jgi:uncharacterized protein (DUF111 family)
VTASPSDTTPDARPWVLDLDRARRTGVPEAVYSPGKTRRLGTDAIVVCPLDVEGAVVDVLFTWTTTLGVRRRPMGRYEAGRSERTVDVDGRAIRVEVRSWRGRTLGWKAEHDNVVDAARALGRTPDGVAAAVDRSMPV